MRFAAAVTVLAGLAAAHPGHDVRQEAAERRAFLKNTKRADLSHCASKLKARGVEARNVARRSATAKALAKKKRDTDSVLATSHNETGLGYTLNTAESTLFTGNASCTLTPEVTQGPYYVAGEYVRRNVIEDQKGVDLVLDFQVVDVNTCEPVPDVYLEMWHCNATGVYSGISASGNGDSSDTTNLDKTFLRGIQPTDADGVAQFESIFPGHYTSRATHIHVLVHTNATEIANSTLGVTSTTASHVGQTFFDQDLISLVEATAPYSTNTQDLTENADDSILAEEADEGVDPLMDYTLLGDDVTDGIFAWIAFGINATESYSITPAATYYESGGVESESSGGMGGGSPPS